MASFFEVYLGLKKVLAASAQIFLMRVRSVCRMGRENRCFFIGKGLEGVMLNYNNKIVHRDVCGIEEITAAMEKFLRGFKYAFQGLVYAFGTQINFRVHVFAAVVAILLGFYLKIDAAEWIWILGAILVVLIVELLNTAIEVLVDLVSPNYHPKAGIIKDVSAGAVLLTAVFAVLVGLFIFAPKVF